MKTYRYFLLVTAIVTFLLVVIGNVVRASDAALSCPDWPTCYGQLSFPAGIEARIQVVHRVLAALSTLMILLAAVCGYRLKGHRIILLPLTAALPLIVIQVILGGGLVVNGAPTVITGFHFGLALAILGLVVFSTTAVYGLSSSHTFDVLRKQMGLSPVFNDDPTHSDSSNARLWEATLDYRSLFARLALASILSVFAVLVSGVVVVASGASAACTGWPLCNGSLPASALAWMQWFHQLATGLAAVVLTLTFLNAWRTQRSQRVILSAITVVFVLFAGQVLIGAAKMLRAFPADLVGLHAASSAALWAVLLVLMSAVGLAGGDRAEQVVEAEQFRPSGRRLKDFILLNKPVIVLLLLVTTYAGMVVGGRKLPGAELAFWTLLGGALAAGGASALNQYIDRELDKNMQRTAKRPLPSGRLTPAEGLAYGLGTCLAAFSLLAVFVNLLAALLSLAGMIYYVLLYSIWLKKLTVQNIVIGGGAGAIPPLVGWAAATGGLNIPSLFLFAIVFLWTPPHFWALALVRRNDYVRAGVPMLPVVQGEKAARWQILIYTLELVGLTLLMPAFQISGSIFLISALVLGIWLISTAYRLWKQGGNKIAWRMYRYSSLYLAFLFLALVLDVLI